MSRLTGKPVHVVQSDRIGIAQSFAQNYNVLVALKGARTVIALPDGNVFINTTGNPGMATAGSGDVLAGMIGGLVAQKIPPLEALKAAVFLHGWIGDNVSQKKGQISLIARDLIDEIPAVLGPKNRTSPGDN
jgi:NAD(P)H-hydrate epimerase